MKKLYLLTCILALCGCAGHQKIATPPVAVVNEPVYTPESHSDWKPVNGTTWAFQVPPSFEDSSADLTDEQKTTIKVSFDSKKPPHTMIIFGIDKTTQHVEEYMADFNSGLESAGARIVDTKKALASKGMSGLDTILSLYIVEEKVFVVHFSAVANGKAYSLECFSDANPRALAPLCLSVMHTVKITTK
jgi:hypothetical protein